MSLVIGKVLDYVIKNKVCCICEVVKRVGRQLKKYDCRKNYLGLFKVMEVSVVVEFFINVIKLNVKFFIYVGDDDFIIEFYLK